MEDGRVTAVEKELMVVRATGQYGPGFVEGAPLNSIPREILKRINVRSTRTDSPGRRSMLMARTRPDGPLRAAPRHATPTHRSSFEYVSTRALLLPLPVAFAFTFDSLCPFTFASPFPSASLLGQKRRDA